MDNPTPQTHLISNDQPPQTHLTPNDQPPQPQTQNGGILDYESITFPPNDKEHTNGMPIDNPIETNQMEDERDENEFTKKRKQDDEFENSSSKKPKSEFEDINNITIENNPLFFNEDVSESINFSANNFQIQENITIIENPNEEELKKIREKREEIKQKKKILLKRKFELLTDEINLIDQFLDNIPIENKTILEPVISIPPIKTPIKPIKKKPAKKAVKKEVKKEPKPKKEKVEKATEKKKTPKKETPKKEVKKEVKKEPATKKEKETTKKEVKKEAPTKKTPRTTKKVGKSAKLNKCKTILEKLMKDKFAAPFNVPVDYVLFNIPQYPKIIKDPMDFGTIKKTLETGKYTEVAEFINDIDLVFENCWKFNGVNSEIGNYATHLNNEFKKLAAGLEEEGDEDFSPVDAPKKKAPKKKPGASTTKKSEPVKEVKEVKETKTTKATKKATTEKPSKETKAKETKDTKKATPTTKKKAKVEPEVVKETPKEKELQKTIDYLTENMRTIQEDIERMKKEKEKLEKKQPPTSPKRTSKPKTATKVVKKKPKKEDVRPMSFKEKHELSLAINNLDSEHLGEVVKIISERMPELANNSAPDEIEIDIDALDAITLRHLERFVRNCNAKKRKRRESRESPEHLTLEDKQLKVIEAAHATSSSIRELERELATMEGRPIPPPIDVPLALPVKKNQKSKKNSNNPSDMLNSDDSLSDSDLMSSGDEDDDLQIVPTSNVVPQSNPPSVSFDVQSGMISQTQLLSSSNLQDTLRTPPPKNESTKKENLVLKNFDQWNLGDDQDNLSPSISTFSDTSNPNFDKSGELWKKLQNRETINKQKEREREMIEEKIKQEKERQEREKREKLEQIEREKREIERKILEEQQRERMEQERLREEERLRAIQELEQAERTVDLQDQHDIENFEKSLGLPYN